MTTLPLKISTAYLEDHLSRLYEERRYEPNRYQHIDADGCTIVVTKWTKSTATIEATAAALRELADDADYQQENPDADPAYRAQARRVRDRARAHLAAQVQS